MYDFFTLLSCCVHFSRKCRHKKCHAHLKLPLLQNDSCVHGLQQLENAKSVDRGGHCSAILRL